MEDIKRVQLSEIAGLITKGTTPTTLGYEFQEDGVNFLKIECFDENGGFIESKVAHISEECNEKLKRSQLKAGDVLFSIAGAIGRVAIVTEEMLPANTNQALAIIRISDEQVYLPYIKLILTSPIVIEQFEKKKQGVAQLNLSLKDINEISIPLPSKEKQVELAELFDKVAGVIAKRKTEISALDDLIKARFVELFGDPVTNPNNLPVATLGELSELITKGASPSWQGFSYTEDSSQTLFVTSENVREGYIDLSSPKYIEDGFNEKQKRSVIRKGDFLINIVGASIGRAAQFNLECKANMNQAAALVRVNDKRIRDKYLLIYLNSDKAQMMYNSMKSDTGRANLSLQDIGNLSILLPSIEQQIDFENFVEQVDKSKVVVQKALDNTQVLFDSLMQKYFG